MKRLWIAAFSLAVAAPVLAVNPILKQTHIPLTFEPNRGQAGQDAQYLARGTGYYLTLDGTSSRMLLHRGGKTADVHVRIAGAESQTKLTAAGQLPGHSSYFRGSDPSKWVTGLPNYAQLKAQGVYPGIDLVYYGNQSQLEYNFVVSPGADPGRIRLEFNGVSGLRINPSGDLSLATAAGEITEQKPVIYQTIAGTKQTVEGSFKMVGKTGVRFEVGPYDRSAALVIDPVLIYSTFLGGTDMDAGNAIASDGAANTYMTGVTFSTSAGDADVLVRKISADGTTFLYTADLGGSGDDYGNGIAVDVNGYAFIGGRTASTDFPTANAFQNQNYGANNAYVLRLDPAGQSLVFSTYAGGSNDDRGYGVAVDRQGSVYLTGAATSNDFPISNGAFQAKRAGGIDAFVIKFAYDGSAIYSTFLGGGSDDVANGIAVDGNGNAYLAGDTNSDSFPQANAPYQHSRHGGLEGFVSELSADGSQLIFSTFIGGSGDDSCSGIAVDFSGNIYVAGNTTSDSNFGIPNRSYNTGYNGGTSDIFVAKYFPNGQNIAWTTFLGSHGADFGNAIATDAAGNVYVVGDTDSSQYPVTRDATQLNRGGGVDAVLSVLDTNGLNLVYSTFYGGSGDDSATGVALDPYSEIYLTGQTSSGDLPIQNAVQNAAGGGSSDAFIAKMSVYGSAIPGASNSVNLAPVTAADLPSSTISAFGRGMTLPATAGKFGRRVRDGGAAMQPDSFRRMRRSGAVVNR